MGEKLTKAQRQFLLEHDADGWRSRWFPSSGGRTYDFVGRVRDAGLITIEDRQTMGWPFNWAGTKLTEAGRLALKPGAQQ